MIDGQLLEWRKSIEIIEDRFSFFWRKNERHFMKIFNKISYDIKRRFYDEFSKKRRNEIRYHNYRVPIIEENSRNYIKQ